MLVDVVELRRLGVKRPRDEVRAAEPKRGRLSLGPERPGWYPGQRRPPMLAGVAVPGGTSWVLPPLDDAWVRKIRDGALVVVGLQEHQQGREWFSYPQAWWCRVVGQDLRVGGELGTVPGARVFSDAKPRVTELIRELLEELGA